MSNIEKDIELIKVAQSRSTEWFKIHAEQRMKIFNFYIILMLGSLAGFSASLQEKLYFISATICFIVIIVTYAFKQLDKRNSELLKIGEKSLLKIDSYLSEKMGDTCFNIAENAEAKNNTISHRQAFNIIFSLSMILGVTGFCYSIHRFAVHH